MINAVFQMVGNNPATIFIVGGILFLLIGGVTISSDYIDSEWFISSGGILLAVGVAIHLVWLYKKK